MKYPRIFASLLVPMIVVASSMIVFNQNKQIPKGYSAGATNPNDERFYQYELGKRLRTSLLEQCSFYLGTINEIKQDKIGLTIERSFSTSSSGIGQTEFLYTKPTARSRVNSENLLNWDVVDLALGKRLFVSLCQDADGFANSRIVVSKDLYFDSIEETLEFDSQIQKNPNRLVDIPLVLNSQNDSIFAGYVTSLFRTGNSVGSPEDRAVVFGQILESSNIPVSGLYFIRSLLRQLIVRNGEDAISTETRDLIIRRLVIFAGHTSHTTDQIFMLFLELADRKKLDISSSLKKANRADFLTNYYIFIRNNPSHIGRAAFERQLGIVAP